MAVYANLLQPRGQAKRKLEIRSTLGTGSAVTIAAEAGDDVTCGFATASELGTIEEIGVLSIEGIPANAAVGDITVTADSVVLGCLNNNVAAGADIIVDPTTITFKLLTIGY